MLGSASDWITAAATTATALAGGAAVWLAVLDYRRKARQDLPRIECDVWLRHEPDVGRYVSLRLLAANRLDETLLVSRIAVLRPVRARISFGREIRTPSGTNILPAKGDSNSVAVAREIPPYGSYWDSPFGRQATSRAEFNLFVWVPEDWSPAPLRIELLVSSKASVTRERRIIAHTSTPLVSARQTDPKASISG